MKFSHVRYVLAVAERGSMHAAARHLGVAQPVLTRSVRELEKELGVPLFERQARGVVLTAMGEVFIRRARSIGGEVDRAKEEIAQLQGGVQGNVSACLATVPHIALLPYALRAFRNRYPDVRLNLTEGRFPVIESALRDGTVDCYVGPPPRDPPGKEFLVEELFDQQWVVLCRKGHPLAKARSLSELANAEWLTHSTTSKPDEEYGPSFAKYGLSKPRLVLQSHSGLTCLTAVAYSDLLMLLPSSWAGSPLALSLLQVIHVKETLVAPPLCMIRRAGLPLTPAAEYFCDMLRRAAIEHVRNLPARRHAARPRRAGRQPR